MMNDLRFLLGAFAAALGLVVVLQNQAAVEVRFLLWSAEGPLFFLLSFMLLVGLLGGYFIGRAAGRWKRERAERAERAEQ